MQGKSWWLAGFVVLLFFLTLTSVTAVMPPEARQERCEESGGSWNGDCVCPEGITSLWSSCWLLTPKEACRRLGGTVKREGGIVGPEGASFKCMRAGEDITNLARSQAEEYSEDDREPNQTDGALPPQEKVKTVNVWWPLLAAVVLGLLLVYLIKKKTQA